MAGLCGVRSRDTCHVSRVSLLPRLVIRRLAGQSLAVLGATQNRVRLLRVVRGWIPCLTAETPLAGSPLVLSPASPTTSAAAAAAAPPGLLGREVLGGRGHGRLLVSA